MGNGADRILSNNRSKKQKIIFCWHIDHNPVYGSKERIRIRLKMSRIRNTAFDYGYLKEFSLLRFP